MKRSLLHASNVTYAYPQRSRGVSNVSLEVEPGSAVHVAGPSGSGKSTLARCLSGLIPHLYRGTLDGEVWLDGLRTSSAALWKLSERAGLVFQNPCAQMLGVTVEEEIIFGLENLGLSEAEIGRRLDQALKRFKLEGLRGRSPHTLSGGEQQKVALAAIVARRPPILLLDEPLSMLDSTARFDLVAHLSKVTEAGTAVVVCEHQAAYLRAIPDLRALHLNGPADHAAAPSSFSESVPPPASPSFELHVSGLRVTLGGRPVLQDISFSAAGGQVIGLVGRNGVGKTTLLRALAGLQKHDGEIQVDGQRPDLGMVFQNPDLQLFNPTVRDEVLYRLGDPNMDHYAWLMSVLGLKRYESTPPLLLSEGEKKRLALATTLMRAPQHGLLLDEPALGQDGRHKEVLIRVARALSNAGQLVILATQDLALAAQADRLLVLGREGIVADGPSQQIIRDERPWAQVGLRVPRWVAES